MTTQRKTIRLDAVPYQLKPGEQDKVVALAINILQERHMPGQSFTSSKITQDYLRLKLASYKNEVFCVLFLDGKNRLMAFEEMFFGTINGATVHVRVVLQRCLELNAAAVIFAHNHPSGVAEPSWADENITTQLKEALNYVDVRVLDHVVVGTEGATSFAEQGLL